MGAITLNSNRQDPPQHPGDTDQPARRHSRSTKELAWADWLLAALAAALTAGYVFFLFLPNQKAIRTLRHEFATKQGVVQSGANLSVALAELRQKLATVQTYNTAWEQDHPDRSELAALFGQITALGKSAQVRIQLFDPQPLVPRERISTTPVDMEFSGSFTEVFSLLRELERLPQRIWIRSLKIERLGGSAKDVTCKISLDIFSDNPKDSDQEGRSS